MSAFPTIPLTDGRDGLVKLTAGASARALALSREFLGWLPPWGRLLLPVMDAATRRWLRRSCSPYIGEIESLAAALALPGVWFGNGTYQWACTAAARDEEGAPWLARTLDWPFPGLGRNVEIARMRGPAGEFFNVTWPGYVGVLTASAPGRFAAAINQAPLLRRTSAAWLRLYDLALNALGTWRIRFSPPDHLLRQVFETCRHFNEAKERLESVPIARPAIFALVGCVPGERCVVERTEQSFISRSGDTSAANDWLHGGKPWEARTAPKFLLTSSYEEAAADSRTRREALSAWQQSFARARLAWVVPPVLNSFTRCAMEMCPARGILRVAGYELEAGSDLPRRVTNIRELAHHIAHDADPAVEPASARA